MDGGRFYIGHGERCGSGRGLRFNMASFSPLCTDVDCCYAREQKKEHVLTKRVTCKNPLKGMSLGVGGRMD